MKFIFTTEEKKIARKTIEGYRQSYIIDCKEFVLRFDYTESSEVDSPQDFIVNKEIEKKLTQAASNKKAGQVIYFNHDLSPDLILNIKQFFIAKGVQVDYFLFDPLNQQSKSVRKLTKIIK